MGHRSRTILAPLTPALLVGFGLAMAAGVWATLPDAHLSHGMYYLAAQAALPFFNAAAMILVFLAGLALAESLLFNRQPVISTPAGAAALLFIVLGRYLLHHLPLPRLVAHQTLVGTVVIVIAAALLWLVLHLIFRGPRARLLASLPARLAVTAVLAVFCLFQLYARDLLPWPRDGGPNLVLVGVDTLRADHMGCYGYHRDTTPNIDRWAATATLFERCSAATPRTTQSMASILTSRYPVDCGVRYLSDRLPRDQLSLAEILKNQGYTTIAVIATGIPHGKLEDGFDVVLDTESEWTAAGTLEKTLEQLQRVKGKFFLFVFFRDPHMPYRPSRVAFDADYQGRFRHEAVYLPDKQNCVFNNGFTPREREHITALYDSEILDVDRAFGRLLEAVTEKGETQVAFFSDHGESLGEHGYHYDHGDLLYQPGLGVPLIIGGTPYPPGRVPHRVRTIDLAPTLLGGLGIELRDGPFRGVDLRGLSGSLPAFSESGHAMIRTAYTTGRRFLPGLRGRLRSLTTDSHKLICIPNRDGFEFELYDLNRDREEEENLGQGSMEYRKMKEHLLSWIEQDRPNWTGRVKVYDSNTRDRLRSLGYLD
jgi:arylsulfatase A-like enzyme